MVRRWGYPGSRVRRCQTTRSCRSPKRPCHSPRFLGRSYGLSRCRLGLFRGATKPIFSGALWSGCATGRAGWATSGLRWLPPLRWTYWRSCTGYSYGSRSLEHRWCVASLGKNSLRSYSHATRKRWLGTTRARSPRYRPRSGYSPSPSGRSSAALSSAACTYSNSRRHSKSRSGALKCLC